MQTRASTLGSNCQILIPANIYGYKVFFLLLTELRLVTLQAWKAAKQGDQERTKRHGESTESVGLLILYGFHLWLWLSLLHVYFELKSL